MHEDNVKRQFDMRASTFERSVNWITDPALMEAHLEAAGEPRGRGLEMCCGTGAVSRALKKNGWDMTGIDISPGMVREAAKNIKAMQGNAAKTPFPDGSFGLVVLRQSYFLLSDGPAVLEEVKRVLVPGGRLVISLTVPFSDIDASWLQAVHKAKQAQMVKFLTAQSLEKEVCQNGFGTVYRQFVTVRESVSRWMRYAPELADETRDKVCEMVLNAPEEYRKLRNVKLVDGEIMEDWNWVVLGMKADGGGQRG
ncbi:MAG: methyltransferase domain-containing protein [Candidatus Omnitrophica bacterium]|nr:methyltransferase domain-containing protein [Candidatus Omnitrophota bacterium]